MSRVQISPSYSLFDQFTTSAPTTLVSGVSGLTNAGVITPATGTDLWDAPAAAFTSGTYAWTVFNSNTIANVSNALQITYVNNSLGAYDNLRDASDLSGNLTVGNWYQYTASVSVNAGSSAGIGAYDAGGNPLAISQNVTSTTPVTIPIAFRATNATTNNVSANNLGAGEIITLDNTSLVPLTLSSLFSTVNAGNQNVVVSAGITLTPGTQAGFVMNLDSATTPLNYVLAYHDGTNAHLVRVVNGVYQTEQVNAAAAYANGRVLTVRKNGTRYSLIYNGTQVGSDVTISDAGIINNTIHGLFSTYATNSFTNFLITTNLDGSLATDGVNTRTVTDTNNALSTSGGSATFGPVGSTQYGNPGIWYNSKSRNQGAMIIVKGIATTTSGSLPAGGWDTDTSSTIDAHGMYTSSGELRVYDNDVVFSTLGNVTNGTDLYWAVVLRSTGAYYYAKGGGIFTNWTLVWVSNSISATPLYPAIYKAGAGTSSFQSVKIPTNLWLPTPLAYDTFSSSSGLTETVGPDAQTTPQLTWTGGTKASGTMSITPTLGSELVTNGDMSSSTGWTLGTGWSIGSGVATHTGSDGTSYQNILTSGNWYQISADILTITSGWVVLSENDNGIYGFYTTTGSKIVTGRATTGPQARLISISSAGATVDNYSARLLTLSSLFSTVSTSTKDIIADVNVTMTAGTQAGIGTNLNSASTPTAGMIAYLRYNTSGNPYVYLDKFTAATTWTNLTYGAITYAAGATLRVITYTSGTDLKVRVYYNNALVGTEQTVSDTSIVNNTIHGLFSTYATNTFDNFTLWARGSGNEYKQINVIGGERSVAGTRQVAGARQVASNRTLIS